MSDPSDTFVPSLPSVPFWKVSITKHYLILKETVELYILTFRDPEAAIKEIKKAEAIIQLKQEAYAKSQMGSEPEDEVNINIDDILKKVEEMYPTTAPSNLNIKSMFNLMHDKKDDIKEIAVDRLQILSETITVFMEGYREGKQQGFKQVNEGKDFFTNFSAVLEENQSLDVNDKDEKKL
eukprot:CAMPEP_0182430308 /NCGR_PEP_ID=MMETSP1167-20130531/39289_1 /TAXON_ID=2988 /ORGANISM="Mallomonas Sp, Strain CCMP3275" /LENGTH=179 /DNA_ID=CAMNT_0024615249 /DNA_START=66 /DNA_END=605 /DNA_ORIENTATION=-